MRELLKENPGLTTKEALGAFPGVSEQTISEHIRSLKDEGLVFVDPNGRKGNIQVEKRRQKILQLIVQGLTPVEIQSILDISEHIYDRDVAILRDRSLLEDLTAPSTAFKKVASWRGVRIDLVKELLQLGAFAAQIAEVLHYPLTTIQNDVRLLREDGLAIPDRRDSYWLMAQRYARDCNRIDCSTFEIIILQCVRTLLDISRFEHDLLGFESFTTIALRDTNPTQFIFTILDEVDIIKMIEQGTILKQFMDYWTALASGKRHPPTSEEGLVAVCDEIKSVFLAQHRSQIDLFLRIDVSDVFIEELNKLNKRERLVLLYHYGYGDFARHTFDELRPILGGVTIQRVAQINKKALEKLKERLEIAFGMRKHQEVETLVPLPIDSISTQSLSLQLTELELEPRTYNALARYGITKVDDFTQLGRSKRAILNNVPKFGKGCLYDLERALGVHGITLRP